MTIRMKLEERVSDWFELDKPRTNMDTPVMDRFILDKNEMTPLSDDVDWHNQFELD